MLRLDPYALDPCNSAHAPDCCRLVNYMKLKYKVCTALALCLTLTDCKPASSKHLEAILGVRLPINTIKQHEYVFGNSNYNLVWCWALLKGDKSAFDQLATSLRMRKCAGSEGIISTPGDRVDWWKEPSFDVQMQSDRAILDNRHGTDPDDPGNQIIMQYRDGIILIYFNGFPRT